MDIVVLDLIGAIRGPAKDDSPNSYKWSNLDIIAKINAGLSAMFDDRPDLFMVEDVILDAPTVAVEGDSFSITQMAGKLAMVHKVTALLLTERASDKYSLAAVELHEAKYRSALGIG